MKKSKTFFACAMLAALASCSNDHVLSQQSPTPSDPDVINIVAASSKPATRVAVTGNDLQDTQFADNEKINVYLYWIADIPFEIMLISTIAFTMIYLYKPLSRKLGELWNKDNEVYIEDNGEII